MIAIHDTTDIYTDSETGNVWCAHQRPREGDLLSTLLDGSRLDAVVPDVLDIVERDPLASAGWFRGDLLRGLMEADGHFWSRDARLYDRYRAVVGRARGSGLQ